ncbi:hypothetical protein PPERSA_03275 [Pseudocohnilembus persalinus]|uniref:RING-type domain-containing protein n=1 Tax=Pseudocohnilembus persalinus TaxID=266149 RepID=A0A0V0QYT6_PSEPJ|nr:hypothetical protein PPERSA_03275 [Pseudocohnilembus persalinus]|eukprot:KRX07442.1 hypothetical protein PPERSA_03275 [Pseudocohnilembus persalinus]
MEIQNQECCVCLVEMEKEEEVRMTLCFHVFHDGCLNSWFKKNKSCPYCRQLHEQSALKSFRDSKYYRLNIYNIAKKKQVLYKRPIDKKIKEYFKEKLVSEHELDPDQSIKDLLKQQEELHIEQMQKQLQLPENEKDNENNLNKNEKINCDKENQLTEELNDDNIQTTQLNNQVLESQINLQSEKSDRLGTNFSQIFDDENLSQYNNNFQNKLNMSQSIMGGNNNSNNYISEYSFELKGYDNLNIRLSYASYIFEIPQKRKASLYSLQNSNYCSINQKNTNGNNNKRPKRISLKCKQGINYSENDINGNKMSNSTNLQQKVAYNFQQNQSTNMSNLMHSQIQLNNKEASNQKWIQQDNSCNLNVSFNNQSQYINTQNDDESQNNDQNVNNKVISDKMNISCDQNGIFSEEESGTKKQFIQDNLGQNQNFSDKKSSTREIQILNDGQEELSSGKNSENKNDQVENILNHVRRNRKSKRENQKNQSQLKKSLKVQKQQENNNMGTIKEIHYSQEESQKNLFNGQHFVERMKSQKQLQQRQLQQGDEDKQNIEQQISSRKNQNQLQLVNNSVIFENQEKEQIQNQEFKEQEQLQENQIEKQEDQQKQQQQPNLNTKGYESNQNVKNDFQKSKILEENDSSKDSNDHSQVKE